jgi:hypothetical protein
MTKPVDRETRPGRDAYRTLTAIAVMTVAGIAATVSYIHISTLALKYGQEPVAAYLIPLSVDGLVATSSLAMLRSARAGVTTSQLARTGLVLGVLATIGANVTSGLSQGVIGAVIAGWPAAAFIVSAEIAIGMVRRKPVKITGREAVTRDNSGNVNGISAVIDTESVTVDNASDIPVDRTARHARQADQDHIVVTALNDNPDMSYAELAALLGKSERTARRAVQRVNGRVPAFAGRE